LKFVTESLVSTFCGHVATMLQENASLENISIQNYNKIKTKAEEYFVLVIALQHKTTLKTLVTTYPD
jgi:hypothetical protein